MKRFAQLTGVVALAAASAAALPEAHTAAFAAATPASATAAFDPYRIIIDRAIFGKPPLRPIAPTAAPEAAEQKQAEALAKKITMCAVNRTPSGNTAVGLIDNDAKPPRNIYLNVGDTADGTTILAADYDAETATIERDGIVITLQLGKGLIGSGLPEPAAAVAAAGKQPGPATTSSAPESPAEPRKREPSLKTVTEQLIAMELSLPPGIVAPPLPLGGMSEEQTQEALDKTITITEDDDDETADRKVAVGWAKEEMRQHIDEGGSAASYLTRLRERRAEEAAQRQAARAEAEARFRELVSEVSAQELEKQRAAINQWLIDNDIEPLDPEDYFEE